MADFSRDDVVKVARLARISLSDSEITEFANELKAILSYVEQLSGVNVNGKKPTNQVTGLTNVMRSDEVKNYGYNPSVLLKNVPQTQASLIKVKRMIG